MKKDKELNVDLIGGQDSLTKQEEKIISEFLNARLTKKREVTRKKTVKSKSAI